MNRRFTVAGLLLLVLLVAIPRVHAQGDQYLRIYNLLQEAKAFEHSEQPQLALSKYIQAQTDLQQLQQMFPDWNTNLVRYRRRFIAARIAEVSKKVPLNPPSAGLATNGPAGKSARAGREQTRELESQVARLQDEVRQLRTDKMMLASQLKEALAARPAAVDPQELARAEAKISLLAKENSLMRVSLAQHQAGKPAADNAAALEQMKRALAEANHKAAQEREQAKQLALERTALQAKLNHPVPVNRNSAALAATRNALAEANRKLAEQTALASKFSQEKAELQAQVETLQTNAEAVAALRTENALLKRQVAEARKAAPTGKSPDLTRQLAEARAQIAALQSEKEMLHLETVALEDRVKVLSGSARPGPAVAATNSRVAQLEQERAQLQKKLAAAEKELNSRRGRKAAQRMDELMAQLETLRAQVAVFEAKRVPYTKQELALFKPSETSLAKAAPAAGGRSVVELPAGSAALALSAQRDFAAKRFEQAEQKYEQILQQNENNVYTLANLAAIELERNQLKDAEKHIRQALALAPDDAYSLLVQGQIDYRRKQYDAALAALSRAAKADPKDAEVQNYLGLTLSQKGQRDAAETALRNAVLIDPHYGSAQNNLAVIYLTQKPPLPALARWHYDKAIAAGFPRNPELERMLKQAETKEADTKEAERAK